MILASYMVLAVPALFLTVISVPAQTITIPPASQSTSIITNGGFEASATDFTGWTESGEEDYSIVASIANDDGAYLDYIHSGTNGAVLEHYGSVNYLSQTVATIPGTIYMLSFWLDNPDGEEPNEFLVLWNGTKVFDQTNLGAFGWTNMQFLVTARATNTDLDFGYQNDNSFFGLDDVSATPVPVDGIQPQTSTNATDK